MSYKVKYVSTSLSPHCDMYLPDKHNTDIRCLRTQGSLHTNNRMYLNSFYHIYYKS